MKSIQQTQRAQHIPDSPIIHTGKNIETACLKAVCEINGWCNVCADLLPVMLLHVNNQLRHALGVALIHISGLVIHLTGGFIVVYA